MTTSFLKTKLTWWHPHTSNSWIDIRIFHGGSGLYAEREMIGELIVDPTCDKLVAAYIEHSLPLVQQAGVIAGSAWSRNFQPPGTRLVLFHLPPATRYLLGDPCGQFGQVM